MFSDPKLVFFTEYNLIIGKYCERRLPLPGWKVSSLCPPRPIKRPPCCLLHPLSPSSTLLPSSCMISINNVYINHDINPLIQLCYLQSTLHLDLNTTILEQKRTKQEHMSYLRQCYPNSNGSSWGRDLLVPVQWLFLCVKIFNKNDTNTNNHMITAIIDNDCDCDE